MNEIIRDGGYKSRKMWFSVFAVLVIFVGALVGVKYQTMAALYQTMTGGVLGVTAVYLTGHVAQTWVGLKAPMDDAKDSTK